MSGRSLYGCVSKYSSAVLYAVDLENVRVGPRILIKLVRALFAAADHLKVTYFYIKRLYTQRKVSVSTLLLLLLMLAFACPGLLR